MKLRASDKSSFGLTVFLCGPKTGTEFFYKGLHVWLSHDGRVLPRHFVNLQPTGDETVPSQRRVEIYSARLNGGSKECRLAGIDLRDVFPSCSRDFVFDLNKVLRHRPVSQSVKGAASPSIPIVEH